MKKQVAEFLGTFWLVFGGCGSALLACNFPDAGIGFVGVSLAFGLTVLTAAYSLGNISGAHLNPAVTIGAFVAGRIKANEILSYIVSQIAGAIFAAALLALICSGKDGFSLSNGFASNGYGEHSPGGYSMMAAFVIEFVLTAIFLVVILGSTDERAPKGFAGIAIGLALTLIHLISIPVTNTSVNPARSISQAVFAGDWALGQLWLFILAPIAGAVVGALIYNYLFKAEAK
jgi:aquaporin Z